MEDAATAEITRVQLWQWVKYQKRVSDTGELITPEFVDKVIAASRHKVGELVKGVKESDVDIAIDYLKGQIRRQWPSEFLTSDLMSFLAVRDGVEPSLQRAAL